MSLQLRFYRVSVKRYNRNVAKKISLARVISLGDNKSSSANIG